MHNCVAGASFPGNTASVNRLTPLIITLALTGASWLRVQAALDDAMGVSHVASSIFSVVCFTVWVWLRWSTIRGGLDVTIIIGSLLWLFNGGGLFVAKILNLFGPVLVLDYWYPNYLPLSDASVVRALHFSLASVGFFFTGAAVFELVQPVRRASLSAEYCSSHPGCRLEIGRLISWRLGILLVSISILPFCIILIRSIRIAGSSGYMGLFTESTQIRGAVGALASGFVPGCGYCLASTKPGHWGEKCVLGFLAAGVLPYLVLGDRGLVFSVVVAVSWYLFVKKTIKGFKWVSLVTIGLLVLSRAIFELRVGRNSIIGINEIFLAISSVWEPLVDGFMEIGMSVCTVAYTIDLVPSTWPYEYGRSFWVSCLTVLPAQCFDGGVHPAAVEGDLAGRLISVVSPTSAAAGGGLGFSLVAESFMNFGYVFGSVFFLVPGILCAWVQRYATRCGFAWRIGAGVGFLTIAMLVARGESLMVTRRLVWLVVLPSVVAEVVANRRKDSAT